MDNEILSGNSSINARIHECFRYLRQEDVAKFKRKFREQDDGQNLHTYRELLVGAFLAKSKLQPRYERKIGGKTPDWALVQDTENITCVIDVVTFHKDWATKRSMTDTVSRGEIWCGWMPDNSLRLFQTLQDKANRYKAIIAELQIPYVVAPFGEFLASIDEHEIEGVLFTDYGGGIFAQSPNLSGVLYFEESGGFYKFTYFANPSAHISMGVPSGVF